MSLKPFPKGSCGFSNLILINYFLTLVSLNHSTFLCDGVFVLGHNQEVLDGDSTSEVNLYSEFVTDIFETFN